MEVFIALYQLHMGRVCWVLVFRCLQIAPLVMGEGGDANDPHRQTFIEIGNLKDSEFQIPLMHFACAQTLLQMQGVDTRLYSFGL